jgi:type IX secretion system PorP/SprF family membrane protein
MKKIITSTFLVLCLLTVKTKAQDIHYSQFYASPLTLNPGLTGVIDGQYRIGAMYRNQWASVSTPYVTPSISFDWNGLFTKFVRTFSKSGVFSGGILILNDESGTGDLNHLNIALSEAYRFYVGKGAKNNISIGLQEGFNQESINFSNLTFESEYTGTGFNTNLPPSFGRSSFSYFGLNAGAVYTSKVSKTVDFYGGVAMFNINTPSQSFEEESVSSGNTLATREVLHAGFRVALSNQVGLLPAALFMTQAGTNETDIGTSLSYLFKGNANDATLYVGGYYRVQDAIIALVGMEYKNVRVGVSYDINVSSLQEATNDEGGFEISLTYVGLFSLINDRPVLFCPRY